jgi:phage terminase large subunit GpA-like protein
VAKFLAVKDDPRKLQDFVNSDLGEDWEEKLIQVSDGQIDSRQLDYSIGKDPANISPCPIPADVAKRQGGIVVGVDVQKDHLWAVVRRYWFGGHSALIDFRKVWSFEELNTLADSFSGEVWVGVDSGYRSEEVYEACLAHGYVPTKGASGRMGMPFTRTTINPYEGTRRQEEGQSVDLIIYDPDTAKRTLSARQAGEGWGRWWIPANAPPEYRAQVTAERYNETSAEWEIRPGRRHNHATDCECIADTVAKLAGWNVPDLAEGKK